MTPEELELFQKRVELSKRLLQRGAPPVAENLVYLPNWNEEEGGDFKRVGEQEAEDRDKAMELAEADKQPRTLKAPLEVLEMIKTVTKYLKVRRKRKRALGFRSQAGYVARSCRRC
jgi:hypothetical protein